MNNLENWKRHFSPSIWESGELCHKSERVYRLELRSTGEWRAQVYDNKKYDVSILFNAGEVIRMACTCDYASEKRMPCIHMAAMLCCIDEMLRNEQREMLSDAHGSLKKVLDRIDPEDLRSFVSQIISEDASFALQFWIRFSDEFDTVKHFKN